MKVLCGRFEEERVRMIDVVWQFANAIQRLPNVTLRCTTIWR